MSLKLESWQFTKGKVDFVDSWPMMSSPGPVLTILSVYLLFVLKWGPAYMEKRNPYKINSLLIIYNAIQVLFSIFLAAKYLLYNLRHGLIQEECKMHVKEVESEVTSCIWWYFVAKITELFDTVFFVLRKKSNQVTFLHLYHHSIMMFGTWVFLKYSPTEHVVFLGFLNSSVHVMMYAYYGIAALGPKYAKFIWWKKYMTKVQLVQFCSMLTYLMSTWYRTKCHYFKWTLYFAIFQVTMFLVLFLNFYIKAYIVNTSNLKKKTIDMISKEISCQKTQDYIENVSKNGESELIKSIKKDENTYRR